MLVSLSLLHLLRDRWQLWLVFLLPMLRAGCDTRFTAVGVGERVVVAEGAGMSQDS